VTKYPSMDQYNDVVQHPTTAFADPVLKSAKIATNGMGLPRALGGGFALTYTAVASGRSFAVRCFHKEAKGLEARYAHIDKGLRAAGGSYFVGFEFQPAGVLVDGQRFPVVKMDWAEGDTLGSFLEDNHSDKNAIERLRGQFAALERFLRTKNIAHGDLQNGNVLVGSGLKLIDYDGVYVPSLPTGQGAELGHKHFQHPKRSAADFGPAMDRFSFIVIDLSLRALAHDPRLFKKYANGENILLTATDFNDPSSSPAIADLRAIPALSGDAAKFVGICAAPVSGVPCFEDFLAGRNIPASAIIVNIPSQAGAPAKAPIYIGAYDVVDGQSYAAVSGQVGNKIELIGCVTKVHNGKTRYGRPFCFVFFNESKQGVKLNIWSDGLKKLAEAPADSWIGAWLSVQGLVDPAYSSGRYGKSLSITVTTNSQMRRITAAEAQYRLGKSPIAKAKQAVDNTAVLQTIGAKPQRKMPSKKRQASPPPPPHQIHTPQSRNRALLNTIQQTQVPPAAPLTFATSAPRATSSSSGLPWGWIIFGIFILLALLNGGK
jgi:hypothetical protein